MNSVYSIINSYRYKNTRVKKKFNVSGSVTLESFKTYWLFFNDNISKYLKKNKRRMLTISRIGTLERRLMVPNGQGETPAPAKFFRLNFSQGQF